jgi:DNA polymerase III epsilon subunit-like protein
MQDKYWVLIDTETTGIKAPIHVVDIGAQLMCGWEPEGPSFQRLINTAGYISPEVSRIHGYTKEILERDGFPPHDVYGEFSKYCQNYPIVSYNLEYDYDRVLLPEWERLNVEPIGNRGFCALRLAQRLLDPVPAGNCKLQTLRQFYRLPERGAHSAMGDVLTVIDLFKRVLKPIAERKHLNSWADIVSFSEDEWYPSRLPFGKHKGRLIHDALDDPELRSWIKWLSEASTSRSKNMGLWYLNRLDSMTVQEPMECDIYAAAIDTEEKPAFSGEIRSGIVIFQNADLKRLKALVSAARERLADLETILTRESNAVAVTQAALFTLLKDLFLERDRLKLILDYRKKFLDALFRGSEEEAEEITLEYEDARNQTEEEFSQAEKEAENTEFLTENEQNEVKELHRKLVRLFHPDRYASDPEKQKVYSRLMADVNHARDTANIEKLREIAADPKAYMAKHELGTIDLSDEEDLIGLRKLHDALQIKIIELIEQIDELRNDPKYELYKLSTRRPEYLNEVADQQRVQLQKECEELTAQALNLAEEIEGLTGEPPI